jgi:hypothetical protein
VSSQESVGPWLYADVLLHNDPVVFFQLPEQKEILKGMGRRFNWRKITCRPKNKKLYFGVGSYGRFSFLAKFLTNT